MAGLKRQYGRERRLPGELAHIIERLFLVDNAPFRGRKGRRLSPEKPVRANLCIS